MSLAPEDEQALAEGVRLWNDRLFFECHDVLEELWSGLRGEARDAVQGVIQAAVAFHHLGNGNRVGARRLMQRALVRLERQPARALGIDVDGLRRALRPWRDALEHDGDLPAEGPPPLGYAQ